MPELPEVEIPARHQRPLIRGETIRHVHVLRPKVLRPTTPDELRHALFGATFADLTRRGKYLQFELPDAGETDCAGGAQHIFLSALPKNCEMKLTGKARVCKLRAHLIPE